MPPGLHQALGAAQQPDPPLGAHMAAPPVPAFLQTTQPFNALNPQHSPVPPPPPSPPSAPLNPHEVPMALPVNAVDVEQMEQVGEDSEMMGEEEQEEV